MKKLITILPVLVLTFILSGYADAAYDDRGETVTTFSADIDYSDQMITAAVTGDYAAGLAAQKAREDKIDSLELEENSYTFEDLMLLSKIIYAEAGSEYGANSRYFNSLLPSERCVIAAMRLLNGERLLEPSVVFQANFVQGGGAHTAVYDKYLGWTYFCYSSKTELYQ